MARELKKLTHTLYQRKYHIIFCSKYRYRLCEQKAPVEVP